VLKGGLVLYAWCFPLRRPTRDIDFRAYVKNSEENLKEIIKEVCIYFVPDDGLTFHEETIQVEVIMTSTDYKGVHVSFEATLGKTKIPVLIDLGFTDQIIPASLHLSFPVLFTGMGIHQLLGYPPEPIISEKFHAMVRLVEINSRWKDFYDIWLLCEQTNFQGSVLQEAISATFRQRETLIPSSLPVALSDEFARERQKQWQTFLAKNRLFTGNIENFIFVVERLRTFLMPPIEAIIAQRTYKKSWKAGQGWE